MSHRHYLFVPGRKTYFRRDFGDNMVWVLKPQSSVQYECTHRFVFEAARIVFFYAFSPLQKKYHLKGVHLHKASGKDFHNRLFQSYSPKYHHEENGINFDFEFKYSPAFSIMEKSQFSISGHTYFSKLFLPVYNTTMRSVIL